MKHDFGGVKPGGQDNLNKIVEPVEVLEESRPNPGFTVFINNGTVTWTGDDLAKAMQDMYDIVVNSMDFGSGFLSTEEMKNIRLFGKAIGAEPLHYGCNYREECDVPVKIRNKDEYVISHIEGIPCTCGAFDV